jgi:hypothetical protein
MLVARESGNREISPMGVFAILFLGGPGQHNPLSTHFLSGSFGILSESRIAIFVTRVRTLSLGVPP